MSHVELYREERITRAPRPYQDYPNGPANDPSTGMLRAPGRGKWRWRFISNGHILADSGQGYSRRIDCLAGCARVLGANLKRQRPSPGHPLDEWMERPSDINGLCFYTPLEVRDLTREATS